MPLATFRDIVIDCADPRRLARFWSEVLEYAVGHEGDDEARLDATGADFRIWLVRVPEPRTVKNRVHIDVNLEPGVGIERLEELGAKVLQPFGSFPDAPWAVLADPEGNEFCAFPAKAGEEPASA
jgi:predicted enzyme related to lactoylglutathione lyase